MEHHRSVHPAHEHANANQEDLKGFEYDVSVPARYRGTSADQRDMAVLGKKQVLRVSTRDEYSLVSGPYLIKILQRNFKFVTMLGFASTVMASWEVLLVLFKLTLMTGGFANLFWGFLVNVCGMLFVYASIAELASMYASNRIKSMFLVARLKITQVSNCWRAISLGFRVCP